MTLSSTHEKKLIQLENTATLIAIRLSEFYTPSNITDVACSYGHWLSGFGNAFAEIALIGYDQDISLKADWTGKGIDFIQTNYEENWINSNNRDLIICIEKLGHINETLSEKIFKSTTDNSNAAVFSAPIIGQPGVKSLNTHHASYWAEKFKDSGFLCFDIFRDHFWGNEKIPPHLQQNLLFYVKESALDSKQRERLDPFRVTDLKKLDRVHPYVYGLYLDKSKRVIKELNEKKAEINEPKLLNSLSHLDLSSAKTHLLETHKKISTTALYVVNLGSYDSVKEPGFSSAERADRKIDALYITDNHADFEKAKELGWDQVIMIDKHVGNFSDKLKSKFFKMFAHKIIPLNKYSNYLWMDASLEVRDKAVLDSFFKTGIEKQDNEDMMVIAPHSRHVAHAEFDFILDNLPNSSYLQAAVSKEPIKEQYEYYKKIGANMKADLFSTPLIMRTNSPLMNKVYEAWLMQNIYHACRDQLSLPIVLDIYGVKPTKHKVNYSNAIIRVPHQGLKKKVA